MPSLTKAAPPKSDQLNADDLIGGPRTIKVTGVKVNETGEQRVSVYFEGDNNKPYKPCKSMIRVMSIVWGDDSEQCVGHSMTLFCDPKVKFGGDAVGGIRISHMTGLKTEKSFGLTATRGRRAQYTVKPLNIEAPKPKPEITYADALADAKVAAGKGKAFFTTWWQGEGRVSGARELVRDDMDELAKLSKDFDEKGASDDEVPFD